MRHAGFGLLVTSFVLLGCAGAKQAPLASTSPEPSAPLAESSAPLPEPEAEPPQAEPEIAHASRYAEPKADGNWIAGAPASTHVLPSSHDELIGVWVDVPEQAANIHVPTALSLAIDTSGSMRGEKIRHAREAAARLVNSLQDGDVVSIVAFSNRAQILVHPTEITPRSRRTALATIEELSADGGTALHHGLSVSASLLNHHRESHLVRRAVVISDGKATVGTSDPDTLGRVAEHAMSTGSQFTSIGVGIDYDEETLDEIAVRSSGRLYHIEDSRELPAIIEEEVSLLAATAAADAFVEIVPARGVQLSGLDHGRWQQSGAAVRVPLGALHAGQRRELLVRARMGMNDTGPRPLASVRLHFRDPLQEGIARVQEHVVTGTVTDDPALVAEHQHPRTQAIIAMRETAMMALNASRSANEGRLDVAEQELAQAEKRLRREAKQTKSKRDARRMTKQADRISKARGGLEAAAGVTGAGRATRSRKAALDLNDAAMDAFDH